MRARRSVGEVGDTRALPRDFDDRAGFELEWFTRTQEQFEEMRNIGYNIILFRYREIHVAVASSTLYLSHKPNK